MSSNDTPPITGDIPPHSSWRHTTHHWRHPTPFLLMPHHPSLETPLPIPPDATPPITGDPSPSLPTPHHPSLETPLPIPPDATPPITGDTPPHPSHQCSFLFVPIFANPTNLQNKTTGCLMASITYNNKFNEPFIYLNGRGPQFYIWE